MRPVHREHHLIDRIGWLRAAVLGANDGLVSTASLIVGVAASAAGTGDRKSTRLNSSHSGESRMPSSA